MERHDVSMNLTSSRSASSSMNRPRPPRPYRAQSRHELAELPGATVSARLALDHDPVPLTPGPVRSVVVAQAGDVLDDDGRSPIDDTLHLEAKRSRRSFFDRIRSDLKRLDGGAALVNLADCGPSEPHGTDATASGNPFLGRWLGVRPFVNEDGVNVTHRISTKITRDGRFLVRVKRDDFCRRSGHGFVPLTAEGRGEITTDEFGELLDRLRSSYSIN